MPPIKKNIKINCPDVLNLKKKKIKTNIYLNYKNVLKDQFEKYQNKLSRYLHLKNKERKIQKTELRQLISSNSKPTYTINTNPNLMIEFEMLKFAKNVLILSLFLHNNLNHKMQRIVVLPPPFLFLI